MVKLFHTKLLLTVMGYESKKILCENS